MAQQPVARFTRVIDFDEHVDKKIKQAILPRTSQKYDRALRIFDR